MARKAPYGTDEQPSWAVKIVGSKSFEVKARNGGRNEFLSRTPYKYSSRPPWYLDDDDLAVSTKSNKPNLKSLTNLSHSFDSQRQSTVAGKHHNGQPNNNSINVERKAADQKNDSPESEAIDFMLSKLLTQYSSSNFKEIYTDMAEYDSRLSGYISEHQVETCLKRHNVPVPSTMLKVILPKFNSENNVDMINYESLIKYLFSFSVKAKQSHVRKPSKEMKLDINHQNVPTVGLHLDSPRNGQPHVSPRSLVKKAMDDREEAYFLVQIEQAFKTNGPDIINILEKLHIDLRKLSNGTEYMKGDQIERTCSWLRVPLHHTLLEKILNRFDEKMNDKVNWLEFIRFLEKGIPLSIQQSSLPSQKAATARNPLPFWESQTPLAPLKASPRKTEKDNSGLKVNSMNGNGFPQERKKWDTSNKMNNFNGKPKGSYEILKVEKFRSDDSGDTRSPKSSHCDVIESNLTDVKPETSADERQDNTETMKDNLERFSHLTEALLRSDTDSNGTLTIREVFRIVGNYNLVYNLHFPGEKVHEIIQSCTVANTNDVVIDDLARKLWNLMK